MKLKKLMKCIKDDEYIKIHGFGECQCACKKKDAKDVIEKYKDFKVTSLSVGQVKSYLGESFFTITIFTKYKGD